MHGLWLCCCTSEHLVISPIYSTAKHTNIFEREKNPILRTLFPVQSVAFEIENTHTGRLQSRKRHTEILETISYQAKKSEKKWAAAAIHTLDISTSLEGDICDIIESQSPILKYKPESCHIQFHNLSHSLDCCCVCIRSFRSTEAFRIFCGGVFVCWTEWFVYMNSG